MVRTQLYLPESLYKVAKTEAEKTKTTFAQVVRLSLQKTLVPKAKMTIQEKYPFIGMFKGGKNDSDNDSIDEFLVNQHGH